MTEHAPIADALTHMSNDYSRHERDFTSRCSWPLTHVDGTVDCFGRESCESLSIIIPSYNGGAMARLTLESLARQTYRSFEVVLVNDGSCSNHFPAVECIGTSVKVVHLARSRGAAFARNVGLSIAEGKSVVFMDDDMVSDADLLGRLALRLQHAADCLLVGFRETVASDIGDAVPCGPADISKDWRCCVTVSAQTIDVTVRGATAISPGCLRIVEMTDQFRQLGLGRSLACWDLPAMVVGHSICARKDLIVKSGGCPDVGMKGWGLEDTFVGARCIAAGCYVVPALDWASYHFAHEPRKVARFEQWMQLRRNLQIYRDCVRRPLDDYRFVPARVRALNRSSNILHYEVVG